MALPFTCTGVADGRITSVTPRRLTSASSISQPAATTPLSSTGWRSTPCLASSVRRREITSLARRVVATDIRQDVAHVVGPHATCLEQEFGRLCVGEDRSQRLIDLVRDRRGEFPCNRQPRRMRKFGAALCKRHLGLEPAAVLEHERGDEAGLDKNRRESDQPGRAVAFPERELSEFEPRTSRDVCVADAPALGLPPVDIQHARRDLGKLERRGRGAGEQACGNLPRLLAHGFEAWHAATHGAGADEGADGAVHGNCRGLRHEFDRVAR